jgi:hypothetical protein
MKILMLAVIIGLSACAGIKKPEPIATRITSTGLGTNETSLHPSWHADYPKKVVGGKDIIIWMYANKISNIDIKTADERKYNHHIKNMTNGLQKITVRTNPVEEQVSLQINVEADNILGTYIIQLTGTDS